MKCWKHVALGIAVLILSVSDAHSAKWSLYFENQLDNKFYIDLESIQTTPEGTILVWEKVVSDDNSASNTKIEQLKEIDCSRRRYKLLQGMIWGQKMTTLEPSYGWVYFGPDDRNSSLFNTICGKGRKE